MAKKSSSEFGGAWWLSNAYFMRMDWVEDVFGVVKYHPIPYSWRCKRRTFWDFLIEGRPRATISALFMFTFRGILGYATQLPLPEDFLGSGVDFPVGNVSFFLFYSGHVAASVIASLDMNGEMGIGSSI
ncbi:hypothetical protein HAX54_027531 [Datura stramonium]|uniref:AtPDCT1/2 transmembrane domain-containing protein n=1 Tax=Datura stramonium TaxID=4076 RepID=A0ABS8V2P7_DATST|nr:hypothetical protein [Datura stramonium]